MQRDLIFWACSMRCILVVKVTSLSGNNWHWSSPPLPPLHLLLFSPISQMQFTQKVQQELIIDCRHSVLVDSRICKYAFLSALGNFLVAGEGGSQREGGERRSSVGMATQHNCLLCARIKCKCDYPKRNSCCCYTTQFCSTKVRVRVWHSLIILFLFFFLNIKCTALKD